MKHVPIILALLVLCCGMAQAANDQAFLGIFAETSSMKMAGMPPMPEMPDMKDLPAGMDLSKMPGMKPQSGVITGGMFGGPQRALTVRLWSPGLAPKDATASIAPPAGLKQGKKLDLAIYRPEAEKVEGDAVGKGEFNPDAMKDFTIKIYWGSSATVKPGQPKIIKWESMPADQKEAMKKEARKQKAMVSYFYKPDWTTGYWPTEKQPGKIAKDASLVGNYELTTNYTATCPAETDSHHIPLLIARQAGTSAEFLTVLCPHRGRQEMSVERQGDGLVIRCGQREERIALP